jgi:hypothetical protein
MLRRDDGRVDSQFLVVGGSLDQFLAPVAQDVGAEHRGGLGAVVGHASFGGENRVHRALFPVPLGDDVAVEELAEQVAVPPDGEIGASLNRDGFAFEVMPWRGPQHEELRAG